VDQCMLRRLLSCHRPPSRLAVRHCSSASTITVHRIALFACKPSTESSQFDAFLSTIEKCRTEVPGTMVAAAGPVFQHPSFTHAAYLGFTNEASLENYLPHQLHLSAGGLLTPMLDNDSATPLVVANFVAPSWLLDSAALPTVFHVAAFKLKPSFTDEMLAEVRSGLKAGVDSVPGVVFADMGRVHLPTAASCGLTHAWAFGIVDQSETDDRPDAILRPLIDAHAGRIMSHCDEDADVPMEYVTFADTSQSTVVSLIEGMIYDLRRSVLDAVKHENGNTAAGARVCKAMQKAKEVAQGVCEKVSAEQKSRG